MIFLSQLLNKPIYYQDQEFGKVIDMAVFENRPQPHISKIAIKKNNKRLTISPQAVSYKDNRFLLLTQNMPLLPYDHQDFYLNEDLIDKQVIDINGRRLVRANDVALEAEDKFVVVGIDVGTAGILRRLGLKGSPVQPKIIPWRFIEAFDYETGNIKIKLTEHNLKSLHPADIADLLEEAGAKERMGILSALDTKQAARAIEDTDEQTQATIVEELADTPSRAIIGRIRSSELADLFHFLNPDIIKKVQKILSTEKAQRVKKALAYENDVAGGMMRISFIKVSAGLTVKEALRFISDLPRIPEVLIVINGNDKLSGIVVTKDLIKIDPLAMVKDVISEKKFVHADVKFDKIYKLFAQYNLRALPVVDNEKKVLGTIFIDDLLHMSQENLEENYEGK